MENREFQRVAFIAKAELKGSNVSWFTQTQQISLKGVQVKKPEHWSGKLNQHYTLIFPVLEDHLDMQLQVIVKVVHQDERVLGLSIENIDLDSLTHLARLIELHLGDAELMKEELLKLQRFAPSEAEGGAKNEALGSESG